MNFRNERKTFKNITRGNLDIQYVTENMSNNYYAQLKEGTDKEGNALTQKTSNVGAKNNDTIEIGEMGSDGEIKRLEEEKPEAKYVVTQEIPMPPDEESGDDINEEVST